MCARYLWTAGGEPAALCTTYVPGDIASRPDKGAPAGLPAVLNLMQLTGLTEGPDAGSDDADGRAAATRRADRAAHRAAGAAAFGGPQLSG